MGKAPLSSLNSTRTASPPVLYAFQLIKEGQYKEASRFVNIALQAQAKNPLFHILNGMIYEKLAETGDQSNLELAAVGYRNALNLDPSNFFAVTQLGKLKAKEKQYGEAQELFANALLLRPKNPDLLHELAAASYYAYDIKTALSAIRQAEKLKPNDPLIQRSAAMIYAAVGDFPAANKHFEVFKKKIGDDPEVKHVAQRLGDWSSLYGSGRVPVTRAGGISPSPSKGVNETLPASPAPPFVEDNQGAKVLDMPMGGAAAAAAAAAAEEANQDPQIIVDCYLLRVEEDTTTSKGVNLMHGLAVSLNPGGYEYVSGKFAMNNSSNKNGKTAFTPNFGGSTGAGSVSSSVNNATGAAVAGIAGSTNNATNGITVNLPASLAGANGSQNYSGHVFASGITWGALTYSLNIANAADERTELVSRPSLMTFLKKQSVFFSGQEFVTGLSGQFGGNLVKYPVGTTMVVTPQSLEGDVVTLNISVEGSLLLQLTVPSLNGSTVSVSKTRIDTQVIMHLGDTLMLGGMYERLEDNAKDGVPGLRDIPVVQYFFSVDKTHCTRRSIIIMVTPRSPNVVRLAVDRAMQRGSQPCMDELATRNPDWFNTIPNMVPLFHFISRDPVIYYEFRGGDILPPSWGWEPSMSDKLAELESFLYY